MLTILLHFSSNSDQTGYGIGPIVHASEMYPDKVIPRICGMLMSYVNDTDGGVFHLCNKITNLNLTAQKLNTLDEQYFDGVKTSVNLRCWDNFDIVQYPDSCHTVNNTINWLANWSTQPHWLWLNKDVLCW